MGRVSHQFTTSQIKWHLLAFWVWKSVPDGLQATARDNFQLPCFQGSMTPQNVLPVSSKLSGVIIIGQLVGPHISSVDHWYMEGISVQDQQLKYLLGEMERHAM